VARRPYNWKYFNINKQGGFSCYLVLGVTWVDLENRTFGLAKDSLAIGISMNNKIRTIKFQ
jgi:hypothetical protein